MAEPTVRFNANLPLDIYDKLQELAEGRTMTEAVVAAIELLYETEHEREGADEDTDNG